MNNQIKIILTFPPPSPIFTRDWIRREFDLGSEFHDMIKSQFGVSAAFLPDFRIPGCLLHTFVLFA